MAGRSGRMNTEREAKVTRLRHDLTLGSFLASGSDVIADVMATAGFDWLLVDLEHGAGDEATLFAQVSALRSHGLPTLVRVGSAEGIRIGRVLDLGADGVMVPRVETSAMARAVVTATRYPPRGQRGAAVSTRAAGYGDLGISALPALSPPFVVVQVETAGGVEQADAIAEVEGVDCLFVGPADLSVSLGVPGELRHPRMEDAVSRVLEASLAHARVPGIMAGSVPDARRFIDLGFRFVAVSSDLSLIARAARTLVSDLGTT
jgi:2-dehydro-3-deoxyglucarate aldolase/4-hydroxy-2-oxoheptanedioate aldolase